MTDETSSTTHADDGDRPEPTGGADASVSGGTDGPASGDDAVILPAAQASSVEATSLWRDAFSRLIRNKAAVAGGLIVLSMAIIAILADVLSEHVTHFPETEQRLVYQAMPPGWRSVPIQYAEFQEVEGYSFDEIDTNGDGTISANELSQAMRRFEHAHYDLNGDGVIDADEFYAAPHGLTGDRAYFEFNDTDNSGGLTPDEAIRFVDILPSDNAGDMIRGFHNGDSLLLTREEFRGIPMPVTHVLGTDEGGRDLLTRIIYGGRISLAVGVLATMVSLIIGVLWGAIAGYAGGRVDSIMMRIVDVFYGIPFMFLVILLVVAFGRDILLLFIALGAVQWLTMSRIVRGQVISIKNREFVEAAQAIGVRTWPIVTRHLIPNSLGPIIVYSTLLVPAVMLEEAFLSFLGLGVQPPFASWGTLINLGREGMEQYPWLIIWPSIALALTLLSFNFLGDGLRDALDPQTKKD